MISICLLTKGENKYLKEWIQHHLDIGIDHFYIYDNNDDLSTQGEVLKHFDEQYFTFIPWLTYFNHMQTEAYKDCLTRFGTDNEWIAFIDTDEFIVCENIHESMAQYKTHDYVRIPWVMYDANGHLHYDDKPVRERFTRVSSVRLFSHEHKSIVQPSKVSEMIIHDAVSPTNNYALADDIKLNHYYTRSLEEWVEKMNRGSSSPLSKKRYDDFFIYNPDLIEYKNAYSCLGQRYNSSPKVIDVRIMAHPSRRDNVLKILEQLDMDEDIVVYDDRESGGDALYTARKAWLTPIPKDKTYRLVLQDDILLCDNFLKIVCDIVGTVPHAVHSLFNLLPSYFNDKKECCYKRFETLSGCAILMPVSYIKDCWSWIDSNHKDGKHDDLLIAEYCREHDIAMYTTLPALVQHLGDTEYQSLLSATYPNIRMSGTYVQTPTDDFTVFIQEKTQLKKFKEKVRSLRAEKILKKRGDKSCL